MEDQEQVEDARASVHSPPPADERDFIAADEVALGELKKKTKTRVNIIYDVTNLFECALVPTLESVKEISAIPSDANVEIVSTALRELKPHVMIFTGAKWSKELLIATARPFEEKVEPLVLVLTDHIREDRAELPSNILFVLPKQFIEMGFNKSGISAYTIFTHLIRGEFPSFFENKEDVAQAQYFRLALVASVKSTPEATTLIQSIVSNWKCVMAPDEMISFGKYLSTSGPRIANKRIEENSVLIEAKPEGASKFITMRVIGSPDFTEAILKVSSSKGENAIVYSISADTTKCRVWCRVQSAPAQMSARQTLSLFVPALMCAERSVEGEFSECEGVFATDEFFAAIRSHIAKSHHTVEQLPPEVQEAVHKAEETLLMH